MPPEAMARLLSATEEAILHATGRYKYLLSDDYRVLLGLQSLPHTRGLLRRLCGGRDFAEEAYLLRAPLPNTRVGGVAKFYSLGSRGAEFLSRELGVGGGAYRPSRLRSLSFSHVTHALLLSRTVIAAQRSLAPSAFRLVEAHLSYDLAEAKGKLPVIPDAWLLLVGKEGKKYPLWIEIDHSTEFFKRFSHLLQARLEFIDSGEYARAFPAADGAVVMAYVVAGPTPQQAETRRQTLARWTMQILTDLGMAHWAGIFRFTSIVFSEVYTQGLFERAVWYPPNGATPLPLLTP